MYHVGNDFRSKKSAFKIYQSLRHNLLNKSLSDITVVDIYKESGIARTTFYRLFDNVIDVLEYQLEIFIKEYINLKEKKSDKILFFYEYFNLHSDLIYIIATQNEYILKHVVEKVYGYSNEYLIMLKISIMTSLLCTWSKNNKRESPKDMALLTKKLLSQNMLDILTDF